MGLMHCTLCGIPPKHYNNISNGKPAFFFALHIFQHMRLYSLLSLYSINDAIIAFNLLSFSQRNL